MSLEMVSDGTETASKHQFTPSQRKIKLFPDFFDCFYELGKGWRLFAWRPTMKGTSVAIELSSRLICGHPLSWQAITLFACKINIVILRINNKENSLNMTVLGAT